MSVIASRSRMKRGDDESGCGHLLHAGRAVVWAGTCRGGGSNPALGERGMKASLQSWE